MYIVSDTAVSDEGSQLLEDMEENLKEGFGFTNVTVNITKSSDVPYVTYEARLTVWQQISCMKLQHRL